MFKHWHRLSDNEYAAIHRLSARKREWNELHRATATPYGGRSDDGYFSENSVAGELAFYRMFGLDLSGMNHEDPDRGWDAMLTDGTTVDIKTTDYAQGKLIVKILPRLTEKHAQKYVLITGNLVSRTYNFRGWLHDYEILHDSRIDKSLPRPAYAARQGDLRSGATLLTLLRTGANSIPGDVVTQGSY